MISQSYDILQCSFTQETTEDYPNIDIFSSVKYLDKMNLKKF